MSPCPCGSRRPIDQCCGPYLAGEPAPTAEALMRSRYTAFTLGNLDYIERTSTGRAALAFDRAALAFTLPGTQWLGLTIVQTRHGQPTDSTGEVTFAVEYRERGHRVTQTETSDFVRVGGAWRYAHGVVSAGKDMGTDKVPGRNEPCRCGSGRKYKKCCGADPA